MVTRTPTSSELLRLRAEHRKLFLAWAAMPDADPEKGILRDMTRHCWAQIQIESERLEARRSERGGR
uniref:Uncharacterized protein n=1 Tax=viral metagenome TaxID=1070528 RepID=A0A6M3KSU1_9ZZZZ